MFKHALVQDAAYVSLLKSTRQQYHHRIAQILEGQFPETVETQPELLAHHYTEAGLYTPAVEYWQRAGEGAVQRSAHVEAVHHLTTGLELLHALPESLSRTQHELGLQAALGATLMATKGFSAAEVVQVYARARELCQQVGNTPQLFTVLGGLCHYYTVRAEFQTAYALGEQCLATAQHQHNLAFLAMAHYMLGTNCYWRGALTAARTHLEAGLAFSTVQPLSVLALRPGPDPGVTCLGRTGVVLWLLGYPDQALASLQKALTLAHTLSHPFSRAFAFINVATVRQFRREMQEVQQWAEAVMALTTEQGFSQWLANGAVLRGWVRAMQGQEGEGLTQMHQGISAWQATGAALCQPYLFALLAEAYGHMEQPEAGLPVLAEAVALVDKTGERWCEAELYRLKGELLLAQDGKRHRAQDTGQQWEAAEADFHRALDIARCQQAKSLELRTALSLSRLWQRQGKQAEARALLAPIYSWFTEGFDTVDLQEAKALLEELGT
jgi:predicted ATPase